MKPTLIIIGFLFTIGNMKAQNLSESQLLNYFSHNSGDVYGTQVLQFGNENLAIIDANKISVTQNGDNQQFYYNESSLLPSNLNINIEGNNSYVEVVGNNQILDNVTINIEGDNRNVIIRNFP